MDLPILKYIDILIGLAVVMILASTVVAAVCQVALQSTYARARALRSGLQELIGNLDRSIDDATASYIAARLIRHPLIGRPNWMGGLPGHVRNLIRAKRTLPPLPLLNPGSVVLREELVTLLLEWASGSGALVDQDAKFPVQLRVNVETIRKKVAEAFKNQGLP